MIRRVIGALIGGELDRTRGGSGVKGALLGGLAMRAMMRMGPFGYALGGAYVAKKMYDRRREARQARRPL